MRKILLLIVLVLLITACGKEEVPEEPEAQTCPASCDDANACTDDLCSEQTNFECQHSEIIPCCGNTLCEEGEDFTTCSDCEKPEMEEKLKTIIESAENLENYEYRYIKGVEERDYQIIANTARLDIIRTREMFNTGEDNIAILDLEQQIAVSFCKEADCEKESFATERDFNELYTITPKEITLLIDTGKIVSEEIYEQRTSHKIEGTNKQGKKIEVLLEGNYGVPYTYKEFNDNGDVTLNLRFTAYKFRTVKPADLEIPN